MGNRKFRSRSESRPRRAQIGEPFVTCKEWANVVKKMVTEVRDQIEVYQIFFKYDASHPPTYLIQGLLKAVKDLEGPEKTPKSPARKEKTKSGKQHLNVQAVKEVGTELEKNTANRMDQVKDLLNRIHQHGNNKKSDFTTKHQSPRNLHKTSQRKLRNEFGENTLLQLKPRKVRQAIVVGSESKTEERQVKVGNKKSATRSNSYSASGRKGEKKDKRQKAKTVVKVEEKAEQEKKLEADQMNDNSNQINQQVNHDSRLINKHKRSRNTNSHRMDQATKVGSKSKTAELQTTAARLSDVNKGSAAAKRARVHMVIDAVSNSRMKDISNSSFCTSSSSASQSAPTNPLQETLNEKRDPLHVALNSVLAKRSQLQVTAGDRKSSAGPNISSGSTAVKQSRVDMETAIDLSSSSSSTVKGVSKPSCSTSGFSSSSGPGKKLQVALSAKENPVQVSLTELRRTDRHNKIEPNSGKKSESPQPAKRMRTNGIEAEDNNASTSISSLSEGDRKSSPLSNNNRKENEKASRGKVNVEEKEKMLEEYQMKKESSHINQQVGNNIMIHLEKQRSRNTNSDTTNVSSKSKTKELKATATRARSSPPSNSSSNGGSTSEKRARVHMQTDIDSVLNSGIKDVSGLNFCTSSTSCFNSSSQSASTNAVQAALNAQQNQAQVASLEAMVSDDNNIERNSGKKSESLHPAIRTKTSGREAPDNNKGTSASSLSQAKKISSETSTTPWTVASTVSSPSAPSLAGTGLGELGIGSSIVSPPWIDPPRDITEAIMREQLLMKQKESLELQTKKLELEFLHTKSLLVQQARKQQVGQTRRQQPITTAAKIQKSVSCLQAASCQNVDFRQRPLLRITLGDGNQPIEMVKTLQDTKTTFRYQNILQLSRKLETDEKGHEIWLTTAYNITLEDFPNSKLLLTKFATVISKLSLWYPSIYRIPLPDLQKLLCGLPNLNHLQLNGVFYSDFAKFFRNPRPTYFNRSLLLPQIKTVSFRYLFGHPEYLISLFEVMPNLKNILEFPIDCITNSASSAKLKLDKVKSVNFGSLFLTDSERIVSKLSQLATISREIKLQNAWISLEKLSNENSQVLWKSCRESWSRILENNKSSIEHLKIEPLAQPQVLKYPVEMKAVKKLNLFKSSIPIISEPRMQAEAKIFKFFEDGFNVHQTFPNLTEVTLEGCLSLFEFLKLFPEGWSTQTSTHFQGVTSLNLKFGPSGIMEVGTLEKVARLFPNVTKLHTNKYVPWLEIYFTHVCRLWPKLTHLKVWVNALEHNRNYALDPIFTGISAHKCDELREYKEKLAIDLRNHKKYFAIPNMTDLKELTLVFGPVNGKLRGPVIPLVSHVAAFYGFQCVPGLKVICAIPWDSEHNDSIRKMISPIKKYMNFNSNYDEPLDYHEHLVS